MGEDSRQEHIDHLFTAELQFRLAKAVEVSTVFETQPLDVPVEWTHGQRRVQHAEIALRPDQARFTARYLRDTTTYLMAVAIKDALTELFGPQPWKATNPDVANAYQIARQIRNAFAHAPFAPIWKIDDDVRERVFAVGGFIQLDTTGLHGKKFEWQHHGGPLALFELCRFVRFEILKDNKRQRKPFPAPTRKICQIGDMFIENIDELPPDAVRVSIEPLANGSIPLEGGYSIWSPTEKKSDKARPAEE